MRKKREIAKNYLRQYRDRMTPKISLERLGELVEENWQNLQRYERMERTLTMAMADAIAPHLGLKSGSELFVEPSAAQYKQAPAQPGDFADSGQSGYTGRKLVFRMLEDWERLTATEQQEFMAVAMIHMKEAGLGKHNLPVPSKEDENRGGITHRGLPRSGGGSKKTKNIS